MSTATSKLQMIFSLASRRSEQDTPVRYTCKIQGVASRKTQQIRPSRCLAPPSGPAYGYADPLPGRHDLGRLRLEVEKNQGNALRSIHSNSEACTALSVQFPIEEVAPFFLSVSPFSASKGAISFQPWHGAGGRRSPAASPRCAPSAS